MPATTWSSDYLAGIHDAIGVDCFLDRLHEGKLDRIGQSVELRLLFEADAVLGGEGATSLEVGVDDGLDLVLVGISAFSRNTDMQVAIAKMAKGKAFDIVA